MKISNKKILEQTISDDRIKLEAIAASIVNERVDAITTCEKLKDVLPQILAADDPLDFVRVTNKNKGNLIVVSESALIQLIQRCINMPLQDDVSPMFVNIIGNSIDTDLSKLVRKRVPEMSKRKI